MHDVPSTEQSAQSLNEAFRLFSQASAGLEQAYEALQGKVARLTLELALANGELRREYEAKLALGERLQVLLDALPAGVVVVDPDGKVGTANPAALALFDADVTGQSWDAVAARRLRATENPEEWVVDSADAAAPRRVSVSHNMASSGMRIVLLHDVTAAHDMARTFERNQRLAAMGEMAAGIAHQLRTPLAAAMLYCGLLRRPDIPEQERIECAGKTAARLRHLERLIQDVLLFTRGDLVGRERFSAGSLLDDLECTFGPLAEERGIQLAIASGGVDGALLSGNREALVGALSALLENAFHACTEAPSAQGCEPRVVLSATASGETVCFKVSDNGPGVPAAARERVFEPFFTTRDAGTGLGLAVAHGVARAHGGAVALGHSSGAGAEFTLELPRARRSAVQELEMAEA